MKERGSDSSTSLVEEDQRKLMATQCRPQACSPPRTRVVVESPVAPRTARAAKPGLEPPSRDRQGALGRQELGGGLPNQDDPTGTH